jgi:hypothetical protein
MILKHRTLLQIARIRPNTTPTTLILWYNMKVTQNIWFNAKFSQNYLNSYKIWWFLIAIKPAEPLVGPVNSEPVTLPVHSPVWF